MDQPYKTINQQNNRSVTAEFSVRTVLMDVSTALTLEAKLDGIYTRLRSAVLNFLETTCN